MGRDARINRDARSLPPGTFILDRYGRPITAGCEVTLMQPTVASIYVQTIEAAVQVDPRAQPFPPGMVKVSGVAHFVFLASKGQPQREFLLTRSVEELVAAGLLKEVAPEEATGGEMRVPEGEAEGEDAAVAPAAPVAPRPTLVLTDRDPVLDPRD